MVKSTPNLLPGYIKTLLDRLLLLSHNKYWLVQWKLFDLIVQLDYGCIKAHGYQGDQLRDQVLDQLLAGLSDGDLRVRNHAGERLLHFLECSAWNDSSVRQKPNRQPKPSVVGDFVDQFVLGTFAAPFDRRRQGRTNMGETVPDYSTVCRVMYRISNLLLKIGDKNLQVWQNEARIVKEIFLL